MKEEPKSTWKKSRGGPWWLNAWLALVVATLGISLGVSEVMSHPLFSNWSISSYLIGSLIIATVCVCLWAFIRWLCHQHNFKRFLFGCACLATLIALFYAEEDLRGKYDWDNYRRQAEANGAKFDFDSIVPPPVPDDQNFAMSPVWIARIKSLWGNDPAKRAESWYGDRINDEDVSNFLGLMPMTPSALTGTKLAPQLPTMPNFSIGWTTARMFDLTPWQSYYRNEEKKYPAAQINIAPQPQSPAADILLALSKFDPAIEQLQQDSQRPYSRFPVQYDIDDPAMILLPHLAALKQTSQVLELRAIAELQNGQADKALDDTKLILRLTDSVRTEPFIITHLVRMAIMQMAIQCIYKGLAGHQWSDAQLAGLDSELAKLDYLADFELSVHAECVAHNKIVDWIAQKRSRSQVILDLLRDNNYATQELGMSVHFAAAEFFLAPKGWFYQGDIVMANDSHDWDSAVDDGQQIISPTKISQASKAINAMLHHRGPFNFLELFLAPELSLYAKRTAFAQESADLARVAIALERYHLAMGAYPDSLVALVPKYMQQVPADVINGQPLHYHVTSDGQFILYSVGWNEQDDGGTAVSANPASPSIHDMNYGLDLDKGDWVWRYPEK